MVKSDSVVILLFLKFAHTRRIQDHHCSKQLSLQCNSCSSYLLGSLTSVNHVNQQAQQSSIKMTRFFTDSGSQLPEKDRAVPKRHEILITSSSELDEGGDISKVNGKSFLKDR